MIALQALLASLRAKRGHVPAALACGLVTLSLAFGLLAGLPALSLAALWKIATVEERRDRHFYPSCACSKV